MSLEKVPKRNNKKSKENENTPLSTSSSGTPKWRQSPIDLNSINTWTKKYSPLLLNGYWLNEGIATLTNTGRTVKIELEDRKLPLMTGGPLKDQDYQFMNIQFRWGAENCCGAEHSIDNHWYSMEVQILHWNTQYGSIEKCYDKSDGMAILSYLIQVVGCPGIPDNPMFAKITQHLPRIKKMGSSVNIGPDCLRWMMEACSEPGYYTYLGSLTTPPYHECVVWIVIPRPIKISARQIDAFRNIYDKKWEPIVRNYRCQQNLRRRRVLYASNSAVA
ncbi:carbonic anhydrase 2 [Cephus cinctus]|uniref:Carbonic anhydrase 2 n=1 Tax=Cephus cinctus TaxID=211228 RepID=A0AAJ7RT76_CEPCN|nr:carbonic anhydrase 2 [Cephus cinctus]